MAIIQLIDPHKGVAWNKELRRLMHQYPKVAWMLFEGGDLINYLNSFVAHVVQYRSALTAKGMTPAQAEEELSSGILNQFSLDEGQRALTKEEHRQVMGFVEELEPKSYSVEV